MPEARGHAVTVSCLVDGNHAGNQVFRRIKTGILIYLNREPTHWYSKHHPLAEDSTFGAVFCVMGVRFETIKGLQYKLSM